MAAQNPTWGEERIADELSLKLQIRLSPRTVSTYIQHQPRPRGLSDQRWSTFLRNHAHCVIACDFFVSVTAGFPLMAQAFCKLRIDFHAGEVRDPPAQQFCGRSVSRTNIENI
jgi:hypothetical protein